MQQEHIVRAGQAPRVKHGPTATKVPTYCRRAQNNRSLRRIDIRTTRYTGPLFPSSDCSGCLLAWEHGDRLPFQQVQVKAPRQFSGASEA